MDYTEMREHVARALSVSVGKDPDAAFVDRHGRPTKSVKEWERWGGEAGAAIGAMHEFLTKNEPHWQDCQECGVGHSLALALKDSNKGAT
jgi:hypothetical protein